MGSLQERLEFLLTVDAKGAISGFVATGDAAEQHLRKAEQGIDRTGTQMTRFGTMSVAAAGAVGVGLFELSKKWEETALTAGKFADATGLTSEQASRWVVVAKGAGVETGTLESAMGKMMKAIDKSPDKFRELGAEIVRTNTGAVDTSATFLNVVSAFQDMGGMANNAGTATAILGKGWQGTAELMGMSADNLKGRLAAVSTQQVIDDKQVAAAKSYRDDMHQLSNAVDGLVLSLGKGAAPVIGAVSTGLAGLVEAVGKADSVTGGFVGKLLTMGTIGVGAIGTLSAIGGQALKLADRFKPMGDDGERHLSRIGTAAKGVGIAMGVATAALALYSVQQQVNADHARAFADSIELVTRLTTEQATAVVPQLIRVFEKFHDMSPEQASDKIAKSNLGAAITIRDLAVASEDFRGKLLAQGVTVDMLNTSIDNETKAQASARDATEKATKAVDAHGKAAEGTAGYVDDLKAKELLEKSAVTETERETRRLVTTTDDYSESVKKTTDALDKQKSSYDTAKSALEAFLGVELSAVDAGLAYDATQASTRDALISLGKTLGDHKKTMVDVDNATRSAETAVIAQAKAFATLDGATLNSKAGIDRMVMSLRDQENTLAPNNPLRGRLDEYINKLLAIPTDVTTNINANYTKSGTPPSPADLAAMLAGGGSATTLKPFASGGIVTRPTAALIGEGGEAEAVIPLSKLAGMGQGTTIALTVNAGLGVDGPAVGAQIVDLLKQYARTNGPVTFT